MVSFVIGVIVGVALGYGYRAIINRKGKEVEARLMDVVKSEISK